MTTAREMIENEWRPSSGGDPCEHGGQRSKCEVCDAKQTQEAAERVIDELIAERDKALAGYSNETYCAYCGFRIALDDDAANGISEHIRTCEMHPMREVEQERDTARAAHVLADRERQEALERVRGLEKQIAVMDKSDVDWERERYRDRLDRAFFIISKEFRDDDDGIARCIGWCMKCLAAIDAEVEKKP